MGYVYSYEKNEIDGWKVKGTDSYSGTVTDDTTLYFYYEKPVNIKVYDHFGEDVEERLDITVDKGTSYDYDALQREGWLVVGTENYKGIADTDIELHFYYETIPELPSEPKTGQTGSPFETLSIIRAGVFLVTLISRKRK